MAWTSHSSVPLAWLAVACVLGVGCDGGPDCRLNQDCPPGQHCEGEVCLPGSCIESATRPCFYGPPEARGVGACTDGTETCTDGEWADCLGQVLPGTETCNSIDDDCDGTIDDSYHADTDPPCSTTEIYSVSGDVAVFDPLIVTGTTERWFRVRFREDSSSSTPIWGYLAFAFGSSPAFEMHVYCVPCGGTQVGYASSYVDAINLEAPDHSGNTDTFDVLVEIRFRDVGWGYCQGWEVSVYGGWLRGTFTPVDIPATCG